MLYLILYGRLGRQFMRTDQKSGELEKPWRMGSLECMAPRLWYAERAKAETWGGTPVRQEVKAIVYD